MTGCRHSSSAGPNPPTEPDNVAKPIAGDYSAFLLRNGTYSEFQQLLTMINGASPSEGGSNAGFRVGIRVEGVEGGVLVVGFDHNAPAAERTEVLAIMQRAAIVDHVEVGGCDIHLNECRTWTSSATVSGSGG